MNEFWTQETTPEQSEEMLEAMASKIKRRHLEVPAILALEMHKPLARILGNATVVFSPFLVPFLGFDSVNKYSQFFSERENWDKLIQVLEDDSTSAQNEGNS